MSVFDDLEKEIAAQQKGNEKKPVFYVGEQLKEICAESEDFARLVLEDFKNADMSLAKCETKIRAAAHKNGGFCGGKEADKIIRDFYGLGTVEAEKPKPKKSGVLNLADFL